MFFTSWRNFLLGSGGTILLSIGATAVPAAKAAQRPYQAQWIWCNVTSPQPFQFVRFHKTIELALPPKTATAYITADTFYRLWVNGQLAMHGPARSSRGKATVDPVEVGRLLHAGKNAAVRSKCFTVAVPSRPWPRPRDCFANWRLNRAASGRSWRQRMPPGKPPKSPPGTANRSASTTREDGLRTTTRGRSWRRKAQPAVVLGAVGMAPWRTVDLRDIPLPAPLVPVRPLAVVAVQRGDGRVGDIASGTASICRGPEGSTFHVVLAVGDRAPPQRPRGGGLSPGVTDKGHGDTLLKGDASFTYDLGLAYVGFIGYRGQRPQGQFSISHGTSGSPPTTRAPRGHSGNSTSFRYTLRDGRQSFLAFNPQFVRFLRIVHRGQGDLRVHRLWLTEFRFDGQPKGDFRCSDEQLNRVYQAARRTAMLVTLDAFMDSPHRERNAMYSSRHIGWKAFFPMFGDTRISRRSISTARQRGRSGTKGPAGVDSSRLSHAPLRFRSIIPTGPLFWVLHVGLYERYSGDTEFIRTMIPVMTAQPGGFRSLSQPRGFARIHPSHPGCSSIMPTFSGSPIRTDGISVALNALYAKTLDEAARLERLVGDGAHAGGFRGAGQPSARGA